MNYLKHHLAIFCGLSILMIQCPFEDPPPRPTGDAVLQFTSMKSASEMPVAEIPVEIYVAESFLGDYTIGAGDSLDTVKATQFPLLAVDTDAKGKVTIKDFNHTNYVYFFDNEKKQKYGGFQITANKTRVFVIDLDK